MTLKELKEKILNNDLNESIFVFECKDNKFLANQYANEIAKLKNLPIVYAESLDECKSDDSIFGDMIDCLYIYNTDKLNCGLSYFEDDFKNLIIICNSDSEQSITHNIIEFPKLQDWQILDYMKVKCPLVSENILKWLQDVTKNDIYRISNELDKVAIFKQFEHEQLFNQINEENGYNDLNSNTIYNLTNAIIKRDLTTIKDILIDIDNIDIEPMGLITILHKSFKQVIDIQLGSNVTAQQLNMSDSQFNVIKKYNCGKYTTEKLIDIYSFLTSVDYDLKSGKFTFNNLRFIDYILCSIL